MSGTEAQMRVGVWLCIAILFASRFRGNVRSNITLFPKECLGSMGTTAIKADSAVREREVRRGLEVLNERDLDTERMQ
jgi:hypothetical protein